MALGEGTRAMTELQEMARIVARVTILLEALEARLGAPASSQTEMLTSGPPEARTDPIERRPT